jgi:hypothetical protein
MSSLVLRQHPLLQWFDREPEDTSLTKTRGTHYVRQTRFWVAGVGMPLVHIDQEQGKGQCTGVQASLLPRNVLPPSLVRLSGRHDLQRENTRVDIACLHNFSIELGLSSSYELFVEFCFLSLLVTSLSGVGDHSSTNFIEGGGLNRSSSPPKASPAVPEDPASIPTGSAGTLGCSWEYNT